MATGAKLSTGSEGICGCTAAAVRKVDDVSSSVAPSRGDLATYSDPMTPAAPTRFSTMTTALSSSAICAAMARAMASLLAPAANGTTILICLGTAVCATASARPKMFPFIFCPSWARRSEHHRTVQQRRILLRAEVGAIPRRAAGRPAENGELDCQAGVVFDKIGN